MTKNDYIYDGKNGGIAQGYQVNSPNRDPRWRKPTCYLENNAGKRIYLWVTEVTAAFAMGGSFAQAVSSRTFYARNFIQPTMKFAGIAPNQYQYNRLAEFVRGTHLRASRDKDGGRIIRLVMAQPNRVQRGERYRHAVYDFDGYILKIVRGAKRFEFQPAYEFEFAIATSRQGIFQTEAAKISELKSWAQITSVPGYNKGFVSDPGNATRAFAESHNLTPAEVESLDN